MHFSRKVLVTQPFELVKDELLVHLVLKLHLSRDIRRHVRDQYLDEDLDTDDGVLSDKKAPNAR